MLQSLKTFSLLLIVLSLPAFAQDKPVFPPRPTPEVQKLLNEADSAQKRYDWKAAIQSYETAIDYARKTKDGTGEGIGLVNLGNVLFRIGQLPKAREQYQQALSLFQQAGTKNGQATVLNLLGIIHSQMGQAQKAGEYYQQALSLSQQTGDKNGEASTLTNLGVLSSRTGQPQKAIQQYQQAVLLYRQLGNKAKEAGALMNLGIVYSETGQPQKAIELYQQTLTLFRQTGDKAGEARTLSNLGTVYARIGRQQQAREYHQQSLPLFRQTGDKNGEANALMNLGIVYADTKQPQKAIEFYQQALLLYRETGDKTGEARSLGNLGTVYFLAGQSQKARDFYQQALPLQQQAGNKAGEARVLSNLGNLCVLAGQSQQAIEQYERALALFRQTGDKNGEISTLSDLGSVYAETGQSQKAIASLSQSLSISETVRSRIGGSVANRQEYFFQWRKAHQLLLSLLLEQHQNARAFAVLQSGKGRSLLDQSVQTKGLLSAIPAEQKAALHQLWHELDRQSLVVTALELRAAKTEQSNAALETAKIALAEVESALQTEQDALLVRFPDAWQTAKMVTLAETAAFLPADTALLDYAVVNVGTGKAKNRDMHVLFVVTTEHGKPVLKVHLLSVKRAQLIALAESLRQACAEAGHSYKPLAKRLASLLLPAEVQQRLVSKKRLVVCPDGAVWNVPFAALLLPDGKHLLERFEIDYAYSATGAQAALTVSPKSKAAGMLVLANPDFGDTSRFGDNLPDQIAKGTERPLSDPARPLSDPARPLSDPARFALVVERGKIKSLPGTKAEAESLHKLYPGAILLTGKDAQESALVKALPKYRYLHFATHGLFSDAAPLQSAIVLAVPPRGSENDGFLTAREIYELKLNAEMAVLSACETARGVNQEGEGVVGLTWALFAAGCPTQVVSLWKVSDNSTPVLMKKFYGNLKRGQGKGKALQNAALSMMKDGKHSHPYHWAAFVLFGDWR